MPFDIGATVVYPHHGVAVVERHEKREVFGETREYLVLRFRGDDLVVRVPVDQAGDVGLRPPISEDEVEDLLAVLRRNARMPSNWSRRYKNHLEKLKTGDVYQVAEVVRNLVVRSRASNLSAAEQEMLATARTILLSEISVALGVTEEQAHERVLEELDGGARERGAEPVAPRS